MEETVEITQQQAEGLKQEFIAGLGRLGGIPVEKPEKQVIVVVGGFPGSGKTTAADNLAGNLSGAVHIQSNSARFLLSRKSFSYGANVHEVIKAVLEELLSQGYSIVLDGMATEKEERQKIQEAADKHGAGVSYIVVMADTGIAKQRARVRYTDGKSSSFEDWRAKPERLEMYIISMTERKQKLEATIPEITGVQVIDNNGTIEELHQKTRDVLNKIL